MTPNFPEPLTYYHSEKGYPNNCVEAANKMRSACIKAYEKSTSLIEKEISLRETKAWVAGKESVGVPLRALDEDEVYEFSIKFWEKLAEKTGYQEKPPITFLTNLCELISQRFGVPEVTKELISKVLIALHEYTGEVYLGDITATSIALLSLMRRK